MGYQTIELLTDGAVGTIRLNRPERMNAVIEEMYLEIHDVLARTLDDPAIRCLILTGSVLKKDGVEKPAFCAGADLKKHASGERGPVERSRYIRLAHGTTREILEFPKPILAAVNGPARGAGTEMALACDLLLIADEATLAFPETAVGTCVGGGVTHILPRIVGLARARELIYTGRVIEGREAVRIGLALASYPAAALLENAHALAHEIAEKAPMSIALVKKLLRLSPGRGIESALESETEAILDCMETEDWHEGLRAFVEKRKPRFGGR